jgi:DNA-binding NarL/FixJ family response regulator
MVLVSNRPAEIVGRGAQLATLRQLIDDPAGTRALEIHGEPGIGKTLLWRDALAWGRDLGYRVLTTRCCEEEMSGALVGLVDLFEDVAVDRCAFAAETDPLARGRAVLDAVRRLACEAPLLVGIDDRQWLDPATARTLRYVLRRLDEEPVALLATVRTESAGHDPLTLGSLLPPGRLTQIELGPLSRAELRRMLGHHRPVSPLTLRTIDRVSGGNPLYALELARSLSSLERRAGIADTVRLPDSVQAAIDRRLADVTPGLRQLLERLSVIGPVTVEGLEREAPDVDVERWLAEAEDSGFVVTDEHLRVRFAHPLLASAVYRQINPRQRRRLHAQIAVAASTPDARARHRALACGEPDADTALELEEAAERARSAGAPSVAAEFAHHSVRLTPPAAGDARRRRTMIEVTALAAAGEVGRARALIDSLIATLPPGPGRADALIRRFYVENDDVEIGDATLVQAVEESAGEASLRGHALDLLGWHRGVFRGDLRAGMACAAQAVAIAEREGDRHLLVRAAGHLAHMKALAGRPDPAAMARSVTLSGEVGTPQLGGGPEAWLAKQRLWAGDLDGARSMFTGILDLYAERDYELERPYRLYDLALLECAAGNLELAVRHATAGIEAAQDSENADAEGWMMYPLALGQAWLGRDAEARASTDRLLRWPGRPGHRLGTARALSVLGLVGLAGADAGAAATHLARAVELADDIGLGHPGALPVVADAVIALAAAGCLDDARTRLGELEKQAEMIGCERTSAMFAHAEGALRAAAGDPETAIHLLEAAAEAFDRLSLRPDAARCRLNAGQAALRAGRRAVAADLLERASDEFVRLGAVTWAATAARQLERAVPGRTGGLLTPMESSIVRLVAVGAKNRQIASELFVSVATVEAHLTRVYRKLDVRSRTELARAVADGAVVVSTEATDPTSASDPV